MRKHYTHVSVSAAFILAVFFGGAMGIADSAYSQKAHLESGVVACVRDAVNRFPPYSDAIEESGAYRELKKSDIKKLPPELQPTPAVDVYEVSISRPQVILLVGKAHETCEVVGGNIYGPTLNSYNVAAPVLWQMLAGNWNVLAHTVPTSSEIGIDDPVEYVRRLLVIRRWMLRKLVGEIIVVLTPESKFLSTIPDTQKKALRIHEPEVKKLGAGMTYGGFTVWSSVNGEVSKVTFLLARDGRVFVSKKSVAVHIGQDYTPVGKKGGCYTFSYIPDE